MSAVPQSTEIQLAVCREPQADGNEWSIYGINTGTEPVLVIMLRSEWEWGDVGNAIKPRREFNLLPGAFAQILRVSDDDAEVSMSLSLQVASTVGKHLVSYELGKLYRYREPKMLPTLRKLGWLRTSTTVTQL
jgi:hypothetical protein